MDDRAEPVQVAEMAPATPPPARERDEAVAARSSAPAAAIGQSAQSANGTWKTLGRRAAPAPAMVPPPAAPMPEPPPQESFAITASAPSLMSEAHASEISLAQKPQVFGISVDPKVFLEMKTTLQKATVRLRPA
jgi:hypothetical protein